MRLGGSLIGRSPGASEKPRWISANCKGSSPISPNTLDEEVYSSISGCDGPEYDCAGELVKISLSQRSSGLDS